MALHNTIPPRRILGIVRDDVTADCNDAAGLPFGAKSIRLRASARARAEEPDIPHDEILTRQPQDQFAGRRDRGLRPDSPPE
jgi:hypothetical protein